VNLNFLGLIAALSAFLSIWFGHVGVRFIERKANRLWIPVTGALLLGIALEIWSLTTIHRPWSVVTGIFGVTVLWDALEFLRQEKRVKRGHAPANPDNPRHARILLEYPAATPLDLLNRDPVGRPVTQNEAIKLATDH
jgi:hypothetical protein